MASLRAQADAAKWPPILDMDQLFVPVRKGCPPSAGVGWLSRSERGELGRDLTHGRLRVTEEHRGLRVEIELVLDPSEAGVHRALDHDHRLAVGNLEDRH